MNGIERIGAWLAEARHAVVFTGAGMSTESGIPDFRSPGGIWATSRPVYFDEFLASAAARYEYWRQKAVAHRDFSTCPPNVGHRLLAKWQRAGRIKAVITQNIDGLHQLAGSEGVIELHGTARQVVCLDCERRWEADPWVRRFLETDRVPECPDCGGLVKFATISFGQSLDADVLQQAAEEAQAADLFLAMGSSLVVYPAAGLPALSRRAGARLAIINRDPTDEDRFADAVVHAGIGETLAALEEELEAALAERQAAPSAVETSVKSCR